MENTTLPPFWMNRRAYVMSRDDKSARLVTETGDDIRLVGDFAQALKPGMLFSLSLVQQIPMIQVEGYTDRNCCPHCMLALGGAIRELLGNWFHESCAREVEAELNALDNGPDRRI